MDDDDTPMMRWPWTRWFALAVGVGLWIALFYGIGAAIYFFATLR